MYGPEANRAGAREQRLPAISGLAETERQGHLGDAPQQWREEEYRDVHLVRLQEKYRQDMKEMLAKKDEQLQRKDEQLQPVPSQRESPRHLIAAACAIPKVLGGATHRNGGGYFLKDYIK